MYSAIGFDWGGVLSGPTGEKFDRQMSGLLGVDLDEYDVAYKRYRGDFDDGKIDHVVLWEKVASEFGKSTKIAEMLELQATRDGVELNEGVATLVKSLGNKGLKLGLLSNNTVENGQKIRRLPIISDFFEVIQISGEAKVSKPDIRAYELFCESMRLEPSEIVFIDDDVQNTAVARSLGMTGVKFDNISQCINDLKSLCLE